MIYNLQQLQQLMLNLGASQQDAEDMANIAYYAESGGDPDSVNSTLNIPKYIDGIPNWDIGLWQINLYYDRDYLQQQTGSTDPQVWINWLKDPYNNAIAAKYDLETQGWKAWTESYGRKYASQGIPINFSGQKYQSPNNNGSSNKLPTTIKEVEQKNWFIPVSIGVLLICGIIALR